MRVACCYHPRLHSGFGKFHFIADGFREAGHDIAHVETLEQLKAEDKISDLILFEQRSPASLCLPDMLEFAKNRRAIWGQWYFDLAMLDEGVTLAKQPGIEPYLGVMRAMDLVFVKERDLLPEYREIGVAAAYLDQASPSSMRAAALKKKPEFDVMLWGSVGRFWRQRSTDVMALVAAGFKVAWATSDPGVPAGVTQVSSVQPLELPDLIERSKIVLCVDARQDVRGYWSDRIWLAAGAGACILRRIKSVLDRSGADLPAFGYSSEETLIKAAHHFCDDHDTRVRYGEFARRLTMNRHTYAHRAREIVSHVEKLREVRAGSESLPGVQREEASDPADTGREIANAAVSAVC